MKKLLKKQCKLIRSNYLTKRNFYLKHTKYKKNDIVLFKSNDNFYENGIIVYVEKDILGVYYTIVSIQNHITYFRKHSSDIKEKTGRFKEKLQKITKFKYNKQDILNIKIDDNFIIDYCNEYQNNFGKGYNEFIKDLHDRNLKINSIIKIYILGKEQYSKTYMVEILNDTTLPSVIFLSETLIEKYEEKTYKV